MSAVFGYIYVIGLLYSLIINKTTAQGICDNAPTESLRITCQQITNWAANTRSVAAAPASPSIGILSLPTNAYECKDIACLCDFFRGTGGSTCVLASGQPLRKAVRKEYRVLTDNERQRFHAAMWAIKNNSEYDTISRIHSQYVTSPGAHSGPAFLPWHREFIKRLEIALRRVDPTVALPYWDSTLDARIPNPRDSSLWSNELMGIDSSDGTVRTGVFRNWLTVDGRRVFTRSVGATGNLMMERDVTTVITASDYRQILAFTAPQSGCPNPASWNAFEYIHGIPHIYTGGDMLITTTATNDPIFFIHHSMIDHMWELWRTRQQTRTQRETVYPPDNALCSSRSHFANNIMAPFAPLQNLDGLSNGYTDNLYEYAPRPRCSQLNTNGCGSKYLFCDLSGENPHCASKIVLGGNCSGYRYNEDRCYGGVCRNNICVRVTTITTTTPTMITRPPPAVEETCFNEQQCCASYAARDECRRNPSYMNLWCRASCDLCRPTTYNLNTECSNRHSNCISWSNQGECTRNPSWMRENCRQACNACVPTRMQACGSASATPSTTTTTTPRTTTTTPRTTTTTIRTTTNTAYNPVNNCLNQHYCCIAWASRGYCTASNMRSYMTQYCQPSCNLCSGSQASSTWNTQSCIDLHQSCSSWASRGECDSNTSYMWENCRQSCRKCSIGTLSTRLSMCGFYRQVNSRQAVSKFAIEPQSLPQSSKAKSGTKLPSLMPSRQIHRRGFIRPQMRKHRTTNRRTQRHNQ